MMKLQCFSRVTFIFLMSLSAVKAFALDIALIQNQQMSENKAAHNAAVVTRALEVTEDEYGPFEVKVVDLTLSNGRLHKFIVEGKTFNTVVIIANKLWDDSTIGINIPVRLGLLSYRMLLINKGDIAKFSKINSAEQLGGLSAGLATSWETTKIFKYHNFNVKTTGHFEGIFSMLDKERFDYLPRGVYEIYDELEARKSLLDDVVVEPSLALYIPTISRVYVSPSEPRLAKRIEKGLNKILMNGDLEKLLYKYYQKDLMRADLKNRKMIKIDNPYYNVSENSNYKHVLFAL